MTIRQLEAGVNQRRRATIVVVRHTLKQWGSNSSVTTAAVWRCDLER